jgi:hypothetical protein
MIRQIYWGWLVIVVKKLSKSKRPFSPAELYTSADRDSRIAAVALHAENELSVQIDGDPDTYIYVIVWAAGKKDAPSA